MLDDMFSNISATKAQPFTKDQLESWVKFIDASAEFHRKITPKYLKINEKYLNNLITNEHVKQFSFSPEGMSADFQGYAVPLNGIPVFIDNEIDSYEFVYEDKN